MRRENEPKRHSGEWRKQLFRANSAAKREAKQRRKKLKGLLLRECKPPACMHCDSEGVLISGAEHKPQRPELANKWFYICPQCEDSFVSCHKETKTPMGKMANRETRVARIAAHASFDGAWSRIGLTRFAAYKILAKEMKLSREDCHIAHFSIEQCAEVIRLCGKLR